MLNKGDYKVVENEKELGDLLHELIEKMDSAIKASNEIGITSTHEQEMKDFATAVLEALITEDTFELNKFVNRFDLIG